MEYKLAELKEKIRKIKIHKHQINSEDLEFFNSCDYIVSRTESYWQLDHIQFNYLESKINSILKTISSTENPLSSKIQKIKIIKYDEVLDLSEIHDKNISSTKIIYFNLHGQEIKSEEIDNSDFITDSWISSYNDKGLLSERNGLNNSKYLFKYDEDKNMISEQFLKNGIEEYTRSYKYYSNGKIHLEILENLNGIVKTEYIYDINNLLKEKNSKSQNNITIEESYFNNGQLIKQNYYRENIDKPIKVATFKYDSFGNIKEENTYFAILDTTSTEYYNYSFDQNDNWIEKVKEENNGSLVLTKREIKYLK